MKRWLVLLLFLLPGASAEVDGDCVVLVAGQDLAGLDPTDPDQAVRVSADEPLEFNMSVPAGTTSYKIIVGIGPVERVVQEDPVDTQGRVFNITGNVSLAQYERAGSGLYSIRAEATGPEGSTCAAAALMSFQPGQVVTATMAVAGLAVVGGGAGLTSTVLQVLKEAKDKLDAVKEFKQYLVATTHSIDD